MQHKLVFIETQDVVETTLALDNYRRACDCGRGAVFFSVARYNIFLNTEMIVLSLCLQHEITNAMLIKFEMVVWA